MTNNKIKGVIVAVLALFSLIGIIGISCGVRSYNATQKQSDALKSKINNQRKSFNKHQSTIQTEALAEGIKSDDPNVSYISNFNSDAILGTQVSSRFFKAFYTWNNGSEYSKRANQLGDLISDDVKNNKTLFNDGKDSLGDNYIDTMEIKSSFKGVTVYQENMNNDQIKMIVEVSYESWKGSDNAQSGDSESYYEVTYDKTTNQINDVEKVYPVITKK